MLIATTAELAILLSLRDEMSKNLNSAGKEVQGFAGTLQKAQSVAAGFLEAQTIQKGLGMLKDGLVNAYKAGEESIRVNQQLNSVIQSTNGSAGVTAKSVQDMASSLQLQTKFSDEAIISADNLLLTFTNIKSNIFPQATKTVLDMSVALGQDLKSSAIQLGKALNDPIAGVTALRRVGVSFNETQVETLKQLVATGQGLKAQQMILDELNKEFGGSATNMTDFEKRLRSVQVALDETQESAGKVVIGGLTLISDWLTEHGDDFADFWDKAEPIFAAGAKMVETQIGGVIGILESMADGFSKAVSLVEDIVNGRWTDAWNALKDIALDIGRAMVDSMAAMFGLIPNLLIDALNQGIQAVNKFKIPDKVFGITLPGGIGGHGLGIPEIPSISTPSFNVAKIIGDLGNAAQVSAPKLHVAGEEAADFGSKAAGAGKKTKEAADKLAEAMLKMRDSIDSAIDDGVLSFQEFTNINKQALKDGLEPLTAAFAGHLEASKALALATNGSEEDTYNFTKTMTKLQDVMKTSIDTAKQLGSSLVNDFLGKVQNAFNQISGSQTKEGATLALQIAELQQRIAGFQAASGGQDITAALAPAQATLKQLQDKQAFDNATLAVDKAKFDVANQSLPTEAERQRQLVDLIGLQSKASTIQQQLNTDNSNASTMVQNLTFAFGQLMQQIAVVLPGGSNDLRLSGRGV